MSALRSPRLARVGESLTGTIEIFLLESPRATKRTRRPPYRRNDPKEKWRFRVVDAKRDRRAYISG
jgi:hypothetical protein